MRVSLFSSWLGPSTVVWTHIINITGVSFGETLLCGEEVFRLAAGTQRSDSGLAKEVPINTLSQASPRPMTNAPDFHLDPWKLRLTDKDGAAGFFCPCHHSIIVRSERQEMQNPECGLPTIISIRGRLGLVKLWPRDGKASGGPISQLYHQPRVSFNPGCHNFHSILHIHLHRSVLGCYKKKLTGAITVAF